MVRQCAESFSLTPKATDLRMVLERIWSHIYTPANKENFQKSKIWNDRKLIKEGPKSKKYLNINNEQTKETKKNVSNERLKHRNQNINFHLIFLDFSLLLFQQSI